MANDRKIDNWPNNGFDSSSVSNQMMEADDWWHQHFQYKKQNQKRTDLSSEGRVSFPPPLSLPVAQPAHLTTARNYEYSICEHRDTKIEAEVSKRTRAAENGTKEIHQHFGIAFRCLWPAQNSSTWNKQTLLYLKRFICLCFVLFCFFGFFSFL